MMTPAPSLPHPLWTVHFRISFGNLDGIWRLWWHQKGLTDSCILSAMFPHICFTTQWSWMHMMLFFSCLTFQESNIVISFSESRERYSLSKLLAQVTHHPFCTIWAISNFCLLTLSLFGDTMHYLLGVSCISCSSHNNNNENFSVPNLTLKP